MVGGYLNQDFWKYYWINIYCDESYEIVRTLLEVVRNDKERVMAQFGNYREKLHVMNLTSLPVCLSKNCVAGSFGHAFYIFVYV
jgi:hypothetical protein